MSDHTALRARLATVAQEVREGAVLADIGTDHGYLPLFLLKSGRITKAHLSDINEGPLSSARSNLAAEGVLDGVYFHLADGAASLLELGITDYVIAGMGGELIARIVADAPQLKDKGTRLILQPMSKQAHLRSSLLALGFSVIKERYCYEEGKYYLVLVVEYNGTPCQISAKMAELGLVDIIPEDREYYVGYLRGKERSYDKSVKGKRLGGMDFSEDALVLDAIRTRINEFTKQGGCQNDRPGNI